MEFGSKWLVDWDPVMLRWYDLVLKEDPDGVEREKPVKIFVMGKMNGVKKTNGRCRGRKTRSTSCIQRVRRMD